MGDTKYKPPLALSILKEPVMPSDPTSFGWIVSNFWRNLGGFINQRLGKVTISGLDPNMVVYADTSLGLAQSSVYRLK